jgi:hypothetical protein
VGAAGGQELTVVECAFPELPDEEVSDDVVTVVDVVDETVVELTVVVPIVEVVVPAAEVVVFVVEVVVFGVEVDFFPV